MLRLKLENELALRQNLIASGRQDAISSIVLEFMNTEITRLEKELNDLEKRKQETPQLLSRQRRLRGASANGNKVRYYTYRAVSAFFKVFKNKRLPLTESTR